MHHPEHLRVAEHKVRENERAQDTGIRHTRAGMEKIVRVREAMLASLERDITPTFAKAILEKVRYERAKLFEIADREAQLLEERALQRARLSADYFVLKPLEIDLI